MSDLIRRADATDRLSEYMLDKDNYELARDIINDVPVADDEEYDKGYDKGYDQAEQNEYDRVIKCLARLEILREDVNKLGGSFDELSDIDLCIDIVKEVFEVTE